MPRPIPPTRPRDITTIEDLYAVEREIEVRLSRLPLDGVLLAVREHGARFAAPFVAAGLTSFAIRFCFAFPGDSPPVAWPQLAPIVAAVEDYLLSDPAVFDPSLEREIYGSNLALYMLRVSGSQLPFAVNAFEAFGRALLLFEEIPRALRGTPGIPDFDVDEKFRATAGGVGVSRFVSLAFLANGLAQRPYGLTTQKLESMRGQGVRLGRPEEVRTAFQLMSAGPAKFRESYAHSRASDRRFGMYEFNPLHLYPIIRPWGEQPFWSSRGGCMIAPVPEMVGARASLGIYHQLLTAYGTEFSQYFGHVFSEYCGRILRACVSDPILCEEEIRTHYPDSRGRKAPDWVVIQGNMAIVIECKATRFTRPAITTGMVQAATDSLKQVRKGLKQLHHFMEACRAGAPGLEALHQCTDFLLVVLSLEQLYGVNGTFFREQINRMLEAEGVVTHPWRVVSMQELEHVERHVRGGVPLAEVLTRLLTEEVLAEYQQRSGMGANANSFLSPYWGELAERLGIPAEAISNAADLGAG